MEISDIKAKLTLSEVIKHYGYKADKQNRINCPFHDDKTPNTQLAEAFVLIMTLAVLSMRKFSLKIRQRI